MGCVQAPEPQHHLPSLVCRCGTHGNFSVHCLAGPKPDQNGQRLPQHWKHYAMTCGCLRAQTVRSRLLTAGRTRQRLPTQRPPLCCETVAAPSRMVTRFHDVSIANTNHTHKGSDRFLFPCCLVLQRCDACMRREFTATVPPRSLVAPGADRGPPCATTPRGNRGSRAAPTAPVIEHVPPIPAATCTVPAPV